MSHIVFPNNSRTILAMLFFCEEMWKKLQSKSRLPFESFWFESPRALWIISHHFLWKSHGEAGIFSETNRMRTMKLLLFWEDQPTTSLVFSHWLKPSIFVKALWLLGISQVVDGSKSGGSPLWVQSFLPKNRIWDVLLSISQDVQHYQHNSINSCSTSLG